MLPSWIKSRNLQAAIGVLLGDTHHQTKIGFDQFRFGALGRSVTGLDSAIQSFVESTGSVPASISTQPNRRRASASISHGSADQSTSSVLISIENASDGALVLGPHEGPNIFLQLGDLSLRLLARNALDAVVLGRQ